MQGGNYSTLHCWSSMCFGALHLKKDFGRVQNRRMVKKQTVYGSLEICICRKSRCKIKILVYSGNGPLTDAHVLRARLSGETWRYLQDLCHLSPESPLAEYQKQSWCKENGSSFPGLNMITGKRGSAPEMLEWLRMINLVYKVKTIVKYEENN